MNCPGCGTEVEATAVYCPKCGERVDLQEPPEPASDEQHPEGGADPGTQPTASERLKDSLTARRDDSEDTEQELWQGSYSKKTMIGAWLLCGLISLVVLVAAGLWVRNAILWWIIVVVLLLLWGYPTVLLIYRRMSIHYRLTSQRLFHRKGILRRMTDRIEVIDIDDISFDQTLLQRLVGVGTIHIISSDRSDPVLFLHGIDNVEEVFTLMDNARRTERMHRGLHIESI